MTVQSLATIGGVFAVLTLLHFLADWLPQSHDTAMAKSKDWKARGIHCLGYALAFVPILLALHVPLLAAIICVKILFWSHFLEDTYIPVYLWAKYVRRPQNVKLIHLDPKTHKMTTETTPAAQDVLHFQTWMATPLGAILGITVDQLVHLTFLLMVAVIIVEACK